MPDRHLCVPERGAPEPCASCPSWWGRRAGWRAGVRVAEVELQCAGLPVRSCRPERDTSSCPFTEGEAGNVACLHRSTNRDTFSRGYGISCQPMFSIGRGALGSRSTVGSVYLTRQVMTTVGKVIAWARRTVMVACCSQTPGSPDAARWKLEPGTEKRASWRRQEDILITSV